MRIKVPIKIIELETDNFHPILSSSFDDGTKLNWVIDTGASKSVFDKNLPEFYAVSDTKDEIHSAGIGEKPIETSIAFLKSCSFGKLKTQGFKVALLDLSHINDLYSKSANIEICGLIGGDFLMKYQAVIDYKKSIIKFIK